MPDEKATEYGRAYSHYRRTGDSSLLDAYREKYSTKSYRKIANANPEKWNEIKRECARKKRETLTTQEKKAIAAYHRKYYHAVTKPKRNSEK